MTDKQQVSQRKYSPELRSIPLTFLDCLDRKDKSGEVGLIFCTSKENKSGSVMCDWTRRNGYCPMGYAR